MCTAQNEGLAAWVNKHPNRFVAIRRKSGNCSGTHASHIIHGTDNPFNWPVKVDLVLSEPVPNNAEKGQILGGNLMKLRGLRSKAKVRAEKAHAPGHEFCPRA